MVKGSRLTHPTEGIVDLVCSLDRYGILMIPSSTVAFQVVSAVIAFLSIVTFGMTGYLLGFHIYLCKCTHFIGPFDHRLVGQVVTG